MGGDHKFLRERVEFICQQRCGDGDYAVDDNRFPVMGRTYEHPGHSRDVKAAHLGKDIDNVTRIGFMHRKRLRNHPFFIFKSFIAQAGASSDGLFDVVPFKRCHDAGCRSRGVAHPDLAGSDDIIAFAAGGFCEFKPHFYRF